MEMIQKFSSTKNKVENSKTRYYVRGSVANGLNSIVLLDLKNIRIFFLHSKENAFDLNSRVNGNRLSSKVFIH
jgi:hypothetical protein